MDTKQVIELLKVIKGAYSRFEITERSVDVWYKFLKDQKNENVMNRLERHISTSRFEPTISDLLPTKEEKEREIQERESARNKWIANGGDPDEFVFESGY